MRMLLLSLYLVNIMNAYYYVFNWVKAEKSSFLTIVARNITSYNEVPFEIFSLKTMSIWLAAEKEGRDYVGYSGLREN